MLLCYNIDYAMLEACHTLKIVELGFREQVWCPMDVNLYFFVVVCQSVSCGCHFFAMSIHMLRLIVCWNHIDGVAVWLVGVSICVALYFSLYGVEIPCRRCCGEFFVANVYA